MLGFPQVMMTTCAPWLRPNVEYLVGNARGVVEAASVGAGACVTVADCLAKSRKKEKNASPLPVASRRLAWAEKLASSSKMLGNDGRRFRGAPG
jgi:hypothetical protein